MVIRPREWTRRTTSLRDKPAQTQTVSWESKSPQTQTSCWIPQRWNHHWRRRRRRADWTTEELTLNQYQHMDVEILKLVTGIKPLTFKPPVDPLIYGSLDKRMTANSRCCSHRPFLPTNVARYPCPSVSWTVSVSSCSWKMDNSPGTVEAASTEDTVKTQTTSTTLNNNNNNYIIWIDRK